METRRLSVWQKSTTAFTTHWIAEWLLETWGDSVGAKYAPLSDYFLNRRAHAERSPKVQAALEKLGRKPPKK
jgi:hypothetical protein